MKYEYGYYYGQQSHILRNWAKEQKSRPLGKKSKTNGKREKKLVLSKDFQDARHKRGGEMITIMIITLREEEEETVAG